MHEDYDIKYTGGDIIIDAPIFYRVEFIDGSSGYYDEQDLMKILPISIYNSSNTKEQNQKVIDIIKNIPLYQEFKTDYNSVGSVEIYQIFNDALISITPELHSYTSSYRSGGSIERSHNKFERPSPSISATIYPQGHRMIGNDGNVWEIHLDSRGVHRWVKTHEAPSPAKEDASIREAIELLEALGDDADDNVKEAIETLKALL